jgi:hypothetical protein
MAGSIILIEAIIKKQSSAKIRTPAVLQFVLTLSKLMKSCRILDLGHY